MRDRQLLFRFSDGEGHTPEQPQCAQRRRAAEKILALQTSPAIRELISHGQIVPGSRMGEVLPATFVRNNRDALRRFVDLLANGGYARDTCHQEAALALLQRFDVLDDYALALELKTLGLCESTKSFGRALSSFRYLLFKFRKVMQKYEKATAAQFPS